MSILALVTLASVTLVQERQLETVAREEGRRRRRLREKTRRRAMLVRADMQVHLDPPHLNPPNRFGAQQAVK
jgi:hypothetical protein